MARYTIQRDGSDLFGSVQWDNYSEACKAAEVVAMTAPGAEVEVVIDGKTVFRYIFDGSTGRGEASSEGMYYLVQTEDDEVLAAWKTESDAITEAEAYAEDNQSPTLVFQAHVHRVPHSKRYPKLDEHLAEEEPFVPLRDQVLAIRDEVDPPPAFTHNDVVTRAQGIEDVLRQRCRERILEESRRKDVRGIQVTSCYAAPQNSLEYRAAWMAAQNIAKELRELHKLMADVTHETIKPNVADGNYDEGETVYVSITLPRR